MKSVVFGIIAFAVSVSALAQVTVLSDDFESGTFSFDWTTTGGTNTGIVFAPGGSAGGSDRFGRVEGASAASGGLGVSLVGIESGSPFASDFDVLLDFRTDFTGGGIRQFSLMGSSGASIPNGNSATMNLRYQDGEWSSYNGAWQPLPSLGAVTSGTWNHLRVTGSNWGSGQAGMATYDVYLENHLGVTSSATGLQFFQSGDPDTGGLKSLSLNDTWGANPGFDLDNVVIQATPAPALPTTAVITPTASVSYSGIFPHTAIDNSANEAGIGGLVRRGSQVFMMTYPPHSASGTTSDHLYSVDLSDLSQTTYFEYPGGTHANRYRDNHLGIDVIGAAYIDTNDTIRYLPLGNGAGRLGGRITGTSPHLTDSNKLYYFTMEEGLYEVDFSDVASPVITNLKRDRNFNSSGSANLPGVHAKGLYTAQGKMYITNNGAGTGGDGLLAEWDGIADPNLAGSWTIVDQDAQYTEVTSRHGPENVDPNTTDAVWALGWDDRSVILNTRDAATGDWTKFRLPKSSYTHGHPNGWYTEWPRVRDVGLEDGHLMSHHGMMFTIPEGFSTDNPAGIKAISSHHKMIVDYVEDGGQIIFAGNDATRFSNSLVPKANSNILFLDKSDLATYGGTPSGFGGVAVNDALSTGQATDAFYVDGFRDRVIHFEHENNQSVDFAIEIDAHGNGNWTTHTTVSIEGTNGRGYGYYILPEDLQSQWLRVRSTDDVTSASSYLHLGNTARKADPSLTPSLVSIKDPAARSQGLIRSMSGNDYKLEFSADRLDVSGSITSSGYYQAQLNPTTYQLELIAVDDPAADAALRSEAGTTQDFGVDAASVFIDDGGVRYRMPKGDAAFDTATASGWRRGVREVVTERAVMNIHGTIYEVPRNFDEGGIERILPITTHDRDIFDFASWRGMLVLSGNSLDAVEDGHYVQSDDGQVGLWFGNVDDLWAFGAPVGTGGPWSDTMIAAGDPSDPYLMAGYDRKELTLSHDSSSEVTFTLEVDFLGTGQWETYGSFDVAPGEAFEYEFEPGYSAHWVRLTSDSSTIASAIFDYSVFLAGDFNSDGDYACDDVDALVSAIASGSADTMFDLTGDGAINQSDLAAWLENAGTAKLASGNPYLYGDANLDGIVDVSDLNIWNSNKFSSTPAWCSGDFNADGTVDISDLNIWSSNKFQAADATNAVPEPGGLALVIYLAFGLAASRRRWSADLS